MIANFCVFDFLKSMRTNPISFYSYSKPAPKKQKLSFLGGYKDVRGDYERNMFERHLDRLIRDLKDSPFYIPKKVIVKGKPANLTICKNGTYILKSEDEDIKAVMSLASTKKPLIDCDNEFYSKGNGAGRFLIKEAVKKSVEMGFGGRVTVFASNINEHAGNPIPFYEKMGFKAFSNNLQAIIERNMNNFDQQGFYPMPAHANMYLDEKRIKDYLD